MNLKSIPKITLKFDTIDYENSTAKAYKCYLNGKLQWIPKSISATVAGYRNSLNILPVKFQELTGRVPQRLDTLMLQDVEENKRVHNLPEYEYSAPTGIELKPLQHEKVNAIWRTKVFAINAEMRTGKTFMSAVIVNSRYRAGMINKLVVVAPLRTNNVWLSMFRRLKFLCHFIPVEHFSNAHTRGNINIEIDTKTFVIIDESHTIKNTDAIRTQRIIRYFRNAEHKCCLTGTPIGLHAGDLFWQWYFLDQFILGYKNYEEMSKKHLLYGGQEGKKVVGYTNIEEVSNKISPFVLLLTRKELGEEREVNHSKVFYNIRNRAEYNRLGKIYVQSFNDASKFKIMKMNTHLQQAARGFIFDNDINVLGYEDNGGIDKVKELIAVRKDNIGVIYFKYNEEVLALQKAFNAPIIWGKNSQQEFNQIITDFDNGTIPLLLVQQRISQGFSLRRADFIIYFSTTYDYIARMQSQDRAQEGTKPLEIIDVVAINTIDERIQDVIAMKTDISGAVNSELNKIQEEANVQ